MVRELGLGLLGGVALEVGGASPLGAGLVGGAPPLGLPFVGEVGGAWSFCSGEAGILGAASVLCREIG